MSEVLQESKTKITMLVLNDAKPNSILAQGETTDDCNGINMTNTGKSLKWIAVRGGINDWAVYTHWAIYDFDFVRMNGDKVYQMHYIANILDFSDDAWKRYRF